MIITLYDVTGIEFLRIKANNQSGAMISVFGDGLLIEMIHGVVVYVLRTFETITSFY